MVDSPSQRAEPPVRHLNAVLSTASPSVICTGAGAGVGVGIGVGVGVGVGTSVGVSVGEGEGVAVGVGVGIGVGVDKIRRVFSIPPAVITNSPAGTPSVLILSPKSPFASAITFLDITTSTFTVVASSAASPYSARSFSPAISTTIPYHVKGKENDMETTPLDASSGPASGYSKLRKNNIGEMDILRFFTFSTVKEKVFSPSGKCIPWNS